MAAGKKRQSKGKRLLGAPVIVTLFFIGMLLPTALSVSVGTMRLSTFRVLLLVMFVPMLISLLTNKRGKMNIFDALMIGHCGWALIALIKWGGFGQGMESGGIYVAECLGAYMVGRLYIRSYEDFEALSRLYVGAILVMFPFVLAEAVTSIHILHDIPASALGGKMAHHMDKRMGFERVFGTFDHPILFGVFCAASFSMAFFVLGKNNLTNFKGMGRSFGVLVATFLSGSGGPYVVMMMQMFLVGWERVFRGLPHRWTAFFALLGGTYLWIDLLSSRSPFHVFISYFAFSAVSAYNRINIWTYGTAEVGRNPIFGLGLGDWIRAPWMSESMDNFWLLTAMRYGLPALAMLICAMVGLVYAAAQRKGIPEEWRHARHAWAFTLFGITVCGGTVHLWNALFVLFMFLIGSGAWLLDAKIPDDLKAKTGKGRGKGRGKSRASGPSSAPHTGDRQGSGPTSGSGSSSSSDADSSSDTGPGDSSDAGSSSPNDTAPGGAPPSRPSDPTDTSGTDPQSRPRTLF